MKTKWKILGTLLVLLTGGILILSIQEFDIPTKRNLDFRANYLERVVAESAFPDSEMNLIAKQNFEFPLFSYAFTSYAMTNMAFLDERNIAGAKAVIKKSIQRVTAYDVSITYGVDSAFYNNLDSLPDYSILYLGHLNLMLGCYRLISDDDTFNNLNDSISKSLFLRYQKTPHFNLESYPHLIWIPDNTVALASLHLHSQNSGSKYGKICNDWVEYAKKNLLEGETGLLYSTINYETGEVEEEPRSSMLGWSIMFIYRFNRAFAEELYQRQRRLLSNELLMLRLFRERYRDWSSHAGDMDSGPIIWGYSIPANQFAMVNAVAFGDLKTAKKLERLIKIGAKETEEKREIKYNLRFTDMKISPMAEAMVLYGMTVGEWSVPY